MDSYKRYLMLFSLGLTACGGVGSAINTHDQAALGPTETTGPTTSQAGPFLPTPMDLPTLVNTPSAEQIALTTPETWQIAINATANAVATYGPDGLVNKGFPEIIQPSQAEIEVNYQVEYTINGVDNLALSGNKLGATIVNLESTQFKDFVLLVSAGHGVNKDLNKKWFMEQLIENYGNAMIEMNDPVTSGLVIDNNLTLNRSQFGMLGNYNEFTSEDYVFFMIPKTNIPEGVLTKLLQDSISSSNISFTDANNNDRFWGICKPYATGFRDVTAEGANLIGKLNSAIMIGPYMVGTHCSGSGVFKEDPNGKVELSGIESAYYPSSPGYVENAVVYPFSEMGETGFWNKVQNAASDANSPNPNN